MRPLIVGIAGGSGSGKTTVISRIIDAFRGGEVIVMDQDSYYQDLSDLSIEERKLFNFDHPDAIEFKLFKDHLNDLINGISINKPIYSFVNHTRERSTNKITPAKVILVDGILVLDSKILRDLMDIKIKHMT